MEEKKVMTESESLALITDMIQRAKRTYYETGVGPILWGTVVSIASCMTYLQKEYHFSIGFDIWIIVLIAIIPQILISIREKRMHGVKKHEDDALNAVWVTYAISIFGLIIYQNIIPDATIQLNAQEGWVMMRHYINLQHPDEAIRPFAPSIYSMFILLYAFPTLVTGIVKKFKPMLAGAIIAYVLFIVSCYTASKYDMLLGSVSAICCWLIPGIILRRKYLAQKSAAHV